MLKWCCSGHRLQRLYNPPAATSRTSPLQVDVWSMGVIFYQMLYGKRPFGEGMTQEAMARQGVLLNATQVSAARNHGRGPWLCVWPWCNTMRARAAGGCLWHCCCAACCTGEPPRQAHHSAEATASVTTTCPPLQPCPPLKARLPPGGLPRQPLQSWCDPGSAQRIARVSTCNVWSAC